MNSLLLFAFSDIANSLKPSRSKAPLCLLSTIENSCRNVASLILIPFYWNIEYTSFISKEST